MAIIGAAIIIWGVIKGLVALLLVELRLFSRAWGGTEERVPLGIVIN